MNLSSEPFNSALFLVSISDIYIARSRYEFPDDDAVSFVSDEFTLGTSLLAAPVLVQNATVRTRLSCLFRSFQSVNLRNPATDLNVKLQKILLNMTDTIRRPAGVEDSECRRMVCVQHDENNGGWAKHHAVWADAERLPAVRTFTDNLPVPDTCTPF
jgi:hypothetical protein